MTNESLDRLDALLVRQRRAAAQRLTQPQKAAVVIGLLDEAAAQSILGRMSKQELKSLGLAMTELETVTETAIEQAIEEFTGEVSSIRGAVVGREKARSLLGALMNQDELTELVGEEESDEPEPEEDNVWDKIAAIEDNLLSEYLSGEHPQTVAALMTRIKPKKAASLLEMFNTETRRRVLAALAKAPQLDPASVRRLENALRIDLDKFVENKSTARGPDEFLGELVKGLPGDLANEVVDDLTNIDETLGEAVRDKLFSFPDIQERIEPMYITTVCKKVDLDTLVRALKLGKERDGSTFDFIMSNISGRFSEQIEEELSEAPRISKKDADAAMTVLMMTITDLEASGEIKFKTTEEDEEFI